MLSFIVPLRELCSRNVFSTQIFITSISTLYISRLINNVITHVEPVQSVSKKKQNRSAPHKIVPVLAKSINKDSDSLFRTVS
jgi:hypothetical protein